MTNGKVGKTIQICLKIPDIDTETLKQTIIKDLTFVSAMTVQEYTLYQNFRK